MTADVVTMHVHVQRVRRISAALDLYAAMAEITGDELEAKYAAADRDVIRQYLLQTYEAD